MLMLPFMVIVGLMVLGLGQLLLEMKILQIHLGECAILEIISMYSWIHSQLNIQLIPLKQISTITDWEPQMEILNHS